MMDRETAKLVAYAQGVLLDCPECDAEVYVADNGVWLNAEPSPEGEWALTPLATMVIAVAGGPRGSESRFDLHEHQPPEDSERGVEAG